MRDDSDGLRRHGTKETMDGNVVMFGQAWQGGLQALSLHIPRTPIVIITSSRIQMDTHTHTHAHAHGLHRDELVEDEDL